ncbi:adenylate/guanylate cyclase domain-containing protein [Aquimarina brevivitae]|uniref:Adenylate cyclase n=1 Tax=Aquimarina brevivitae TaxID=323412 RepID=A0A4Q7PG07_9FLAO|nr:adenylate/guanylate cyclase domain-containing protein [Aquimarina brevivitae]RZS99443.1 adenylate cyclase [Aquimarina brevivitae]
MKNERLLQEVQDILGNISNALDAERSSIFLYNAQKQTLESFVAQGIDNIVISIPSHKGVVGKTFSTGKYQIVNNTKQSKAFDNSSDKQLQFITRSIISVPVYNKSEKCIGVIQCINKKKGAFDLKDLKILQGFASTLSLVIKNKQLYHASEQLKNNFSTLLDVFGAISSELELDSLIPLIMAKAAEITGADRSSLFFMDHTTGELWTVYAKGLEKKVVRTKKGIVAQVAKEKKALIVNEPYSNPLFNPAIDKKTGYTTRSILSVPVFQANNEILGVIQVINKLDGNFDKRDLSILQGFASQIRIAIENAKLFDEVHNVKNYLDVLVQNLDNAIVTVDLSGHIKTVNQTFYTMFGLDSSENVINKHVKELHTSLSPLFKHYINTISTGKKEYQDEIEIQTIASKNVVVNLSVLPMQDLNGNIIGAIQVFQDISKEKRIRANLSRYIPNHLVNEVINKDELSMLKGKYGKSTILFSDIRNFTSLTEELGAIQIVELLNKYFNAMITSVYKYDGILDKFIGDAIMAVFGIPYPGQKDPANAIHSALDMFEMLRKLNVKNEKQPILNIGIGISTGNVVSGNVGSEKRFEYTVIGDAVNLAARLESATKIYNVDLLICEETYNQVKSSFHCREIDTLQVKGKQIPVKIYTVYSRKTKALSKDIADFNTYFSAGLKAYKNKYYEKASQNFKKAYDLQPQDGPTQLFIKRCEAFIKKTIPAG